MGFKEFLAESAENHPIVKKLNDTHTVIDHPEHGHIIGDENGKMYTGDEMNAINKANHIETKHGIRTGIHAVKNKFAPPNSLINKAEYGIKAYGLNNVDDHKAKTDAGLKQHKANVNASLKKFNESVKAGPDVTHGWKHLETERDADGETRQYRHDKHPNHYLLVSENSKKMNWTHVDDSKGQYKDTTGEGYHSLRKHLNTLK